MTTVARASSIPIITRNYAYVLTLLAAYFLNYDGAETLRARGISIVRIRTSRDNVRGSNLSVTYIYDVLFMQMYVPRRERELRGVRPDVSFIDFHSDSPRYRDRRDRAEYDTMCTYTGCVTLSWTTVAYL